MASRDHLDINNKETISSEELKNIQTSNDKPANERKTSVREFHVFPTNNPHLERVVRVQSPTAESDTYSVTTESEV